MPSYPAYYRDGFDPAKHFTRRLNQENQYFFAQDLNEDLSAERHARRTLGDALFADGDVIRGGAIDVNGENGVVTLEAGDVYVQGMVRSLPAARLTVPITGEVQVGVMIEERVITHLEDPDLTFRNFPTLSFESHGQPRQPVLQETPRWGSSREAPGDTAAVGFRFFPVFTIRDGQLVDTAPPSEAGTFTALVERYDRESNGHYISRGCKLRFLHHSDGAQVFSLSEGVVNVDGRKIDRPSAVRLTYVEDPDHERINAEPHVFEPDGNGRMTILLNRGPVDAIHDVSVLTEKTVTVTRGQSTGGRDPLPDSQIQQIVAIRQGAASYQATADYRRLGDEVDWSPAGAEPGPGSTYQVTYRYKKSITPESATETGVTITGAVAGSEVDVDYSWKMPRLDVIAIDRANTVVRLRGVASPYNPQRPRVPEHLLELAEVEQRWTDDYPIVRDTGVMAVRTSDLELMRQVIIETRVEQAQQQLAVDALARNPAARNGIFVDNFNNDNQRDAGIAQTASIVNGVLTLSIAAQLEQVATGGNGWTLDYELEDAIVQPLATRAFRINPYRSFAPVPAQVTLHPSIDQWEDVLTTWASPVTQNFSTTSSSRTATADELLKSATNAAAFLRVRDVEFAVAGFGPGEILDQLTFDGVNVTPTPRPAATASGGLSGRFQVPANMPAGSYTVQASGAGGSMGRATYTGRGTITIEERRRVTTVWTSVDPVYQSFTPTEGMHLGGWSLRFAETGDPDEPVVVQLRDAVQGQPGQTVLAEAVIDMHDVSTVSDTTALFANLPWCEADVEKTIVLLTNDPDHAIAVAELGKFDAQAQRWVTAQPYQIGVFGSSSNARAWTVHQEIDACFRAKRARIRSTTRTVELGTIAARGVTDLIGQAGVDIPDAATGVDLIFERPNGQQIKVAPGAVVSLTETLNENLVVKAVLRGAPNASPILFPDPLVVLGKLASADDYVSRAFVCGGNRTVRCEMRALLPGTSTAVPTIQNQDGSWQAMTLKARTDAGDGWSDFVFEAAAFSADVTRLRLALTGSALHRPQVGHVTVMPLTV